MGQLVDLHARLSTLLGLIQTAYGGTNALRILDPPPNALPETPCIYLLTFDEDPGYENVDTVHGRSVVTATIRAVVAATRPATELLALADAVIETADPWLRSSVGQTVDDPIDQARRMTMRDITPVFDGVPTRGADFTIRVEGDFRQVNPAP